MFGMSLSVCVALAQHARATMVSMITWGRDWAGLGVWGIAGIVKTPLGHVCCDQERRHQ